MTKSLTLALLMPLAGLGLALGAATPPEVINYQGVLRDAADQPLSGTFDMIFRYFDAETGGNEILEEWHDGYAGNQVVVSQGLFSVKLGTGPMWDGGGPGNYTSLGTVFRDFSSVWLELQVNGEVLAPRSQFLAMPYALNAAQVGGQAGPFLDTLSLWQTKRGGLHLNLFENPFDRWLDGLIVEGTRALYGQGGYGHAAGIFRNEYASARLGAVECAFWGEGDCNTTGYVGIRADSNFAAGWFTQNGGLEADVSLASGGTGIRSVATVAGGFFADSDGLGSAYVGYGGRGIHAEGSESGGYFNDTNSSGHAFLAYGNDGIQAWGSNAAGYFSNTAVSGNYAYLGVTNFGVQAYGNYAGGYFADSNDSSGAYVAHSGYGVYAGGPHTGGYFYDSNNQTSYTYVAYGNDGIVARGSSSGGAFLDSDSSGYAYAGLGDTGLHAYGGYTGIDSFGASYAGVFTNTTASGHATLGEGDSGVMGWGNTRGGGFDDTNSSAYGWVAYGSYKIYGSGTVSFVQNHPDDPSRVVVYHAPEASEVAVYTRGSDRLVDGEARIALDPTFAWVANPDLGLTAHLTARGDDPVALSVASLTTSAMVVRGPAGSESGFDYIVYGLRIGFEEMPPVQPKPRESYVPSMAEYRALYATEPALHGYTALQRFKLMEAANREKDGVVSEIDLTRAADLLRRIGEFDPAIHGSVETLAGRPTNAAPAAAPDLPQERAIPAPSSSPEPVSIQGGALVAGSPLRRDSEAERLVPPDGFERFPVSEAVLKGDVLALDPLLPGVVHRTALAADPAVIGVAAADSSDGNVLVAVVRIASVRVDAQYGPVGAGDLLMSSPTPGAAMRAVDALPGTILGKALESLPAGMTEIRVLLMQR